MNKAFFLGAVVAIIYEIIKYRRHLVSHFESHQFLWNIIVGLPPFLSFVFLSGAILDWGFNATNHTIQFSIVLMCWVITLFGEHVLETNSSFVRETWQRACGERAYFIKLVLMYGAITSCAVLPYLGFADVVWPGKETYVRLTAASALLIATALSWPAFQKVFELECSFARARIRCLLASMCNNQIIEFSHSDRINQIMLAKREDLETALRLTAVHIGTASQFKTVQGDRPIPGIDESRLSFALLLRLGEEEQLMFLTELQHREYALKLLIGSDGDAEESESALVNSDHKSEFRERVTELRQARDRRVKKRP